MFLWHSKITDSKDISLNILSWNMFQQFSPLNVPVEVELNWAVMGVGKGWVFYQCMVKDNPLSGGVDWTSEGKDLFLCSATDYKCKLRQSNVEYHWLQWPKLEGLALEKGCSILSVSRHMHCFYFTYLYLFRGLLFTPCPLKPYPNLLLRYFSSFFQGCLSAGKEVLRGWMFSKYRP